MPKEIYLFWNWCAFSLLYRRVKKRANFKTIKFLQVILSFLYRLNSRTTLILKVCSCKATNKYIGLPLRTLIFQNTFHSTSQRDPAKSQMYAKHQYRKASMEASTEIIVCSHNGTLIEIPFNTSFIQPEIK